MMDMTLNCGGRPPDPSPKAGSHSLMKEGDDVNMPIVTEASRAMATAAIELGSGSTSYIHHMQFAGGISSSSSYNVRSGTSNGDYIKTMTSYTGSYGSSGGQATGGDYHYNQYGIGSAAAPRGRSDIHFHVQQPHVGAGAAAVPAAYQHAAPPQWQAGSSDHHQRPHSMPQREYQKDGSMIPPAVFNMQVHAAAGRAVEPHERRGEYNYKMGDPDNLGGRAAKKVALGRKVVGKQEDEDEDDEDEEEELEEEEEEKSVQYELGAAPTNIVLGCSTASYGDIQLAGASTSMSGGGMMNMKKRRLTNEQVRSLEVSFERESKLEPERKNSLAVELGLQPRQVAVWFQNRRARFKTKQLERDFDLLKLQYDAVRSEKDKLQAQVARLKDLLDAQIATSKGSTPTTSSEKQGMDYDDNVSARNSSPQNHNVEESLDGTIDIKARKEVGAAKQSVTSISMLQHVEVFSNDNSDPTHVHIVEAPKSSNKGAITLEVKPSLQVPHINHHHGQVYEQHHQQQQQQQHHHHHQQQQQHFSNTFSPPTKLSLCSPQQIFLHQKVSMRMEGNNLNPSYHEPPHNNLYNQDRHNFNHLNENGEEEYRSDSMICFDSAWNHDP